MVRNNQKGRVIKKVSQVLKFLKEIATTVREWAVAIASCIGVMTVFLGALEFSSEREKEALARYQRVMRDLGDPSDTVRAGAAVAMSALMEKDYGKYGKASIPVFVNQLATEPSQSVRDKILSILMTKVRRIDDLIEPLISVNRSLTAELSGSQIESFIKGEPLDEILLDMSKALVFALENKVPKGSELDLSGVFLIDWSSQGANLEGQIFERVHLMSSYLTQANLREANLEQAQFFRVDLTGAFLQDANLSNAFFREVVLKNAKLSGANLVRADLVSTDLREANLTGARLISAILKYANMEGAILQGANLFTADLTDVNLKDANLKNADLKGALLEGAILDGTELGEANLTGASLTRASLKNAVLTNALLENAFLEGAMLGHANLEGANLTDADLADANLAGAILKGADLKGADLEGADLEGANLEGANLQGANLKDANLEGTNLGGTNVEGADLERADLRAAVLFSIDSEKFQSDLDKGTISKGLQQEFENNQISLSENTIVSVEEKDRRWLITDKDNEQTYTVRKEERLNVRKETNFDLTELFSIDSKFQSDLGKGTISEDFQKEFENNQISLSENTSISIEEKDGTWMITDKDNEQTYTIGKEDGQLKIYERTELDPTEPFSIDSKFQSDLDKGTISEGFQQEFENNGISLSQNTTISIEQKDSRWLISDKDNKQTYTVRKEERLNICKRTKFDFTGIKKAENWQKAIFDDDVKQKLLSQQD